MSKKVFIFWSLFVGIALFRGFYAFNSDGQSNIDCVKDVVRGIGRVVEEPVRKENNQTLIVQSSEIFVASTSISCADDLLIKINTKIYPTFSFGDIVSLRGRLLEPRNFESNNDRIFDYKNYLAKDDIYFEMKSAVVVATSSVPNLEVGNITDNFFNRIKSLLFGLKKSFVRSLENNLGEPHSSLASGLVVGEKSSLGKDLLDDFRKVGLIHIVVLSGYNITIIADAMRRILVFLPRVWGIFFGGLGIALFGILVGGGATVVRSCLMAGIALFAGLIRRDYSVIRSLIFVALLMLIENPKILFYDPSFQLSFLATLGLILLSKPVENRLHFITEKFGIRGIVASTVATQIFVSPYILYTMGQISIIGMVVNILVLPFIPITMLFVFIAGMSGMFVSSVALPFAWVSHVLLSYELFIVDYFARLPFASINVGEFSFWFVVGFYVVIIGVVVWKKIQIINFQ